MSNSHNPLHHPPALRKTIPVPHWRMLLHPLNLLALGLGSGLSPIAPGTVATLFAWLCFNILSLWVDVMPWLYIIALGLVVGVIACKYTGEKLEEPDHSAIVWDEILAFWIILLFLSPSAWSTQCWAFIWFRFFDILKPGPIRWVDKQLSGKGWRGAMGVMLDDLLAAFFTLLMFALWRTI